MSEYVLALCICIRNKDKKSGEGLLVRTDKRQHQFTVRLVFGSSLGKDSNTVYKYLKE